MKYVEPALDRRLRTDLEVFSLSLCPAGRNGAREELLEKNRLLKTRIRML